MHCAIISNLRRPDFCGRFYRHTRTNMSTTAQQYDLIVIGGGSGGLAFAKRSAGYGAKVCIIENKQFGGTCVNVGCVPKKIMYTTSHVRETIHEASNFGFNVGEVSFDWAKVKAARDRYIGRLNGIYEGGLDKLSVTRVEGTAVFTGDKTVHVDGQGDFIADHICIAVGGQPKKLGIPGGELMIDSNGFFALESQPRKVGVIGAGYIAVELAGVLNGLGSDTSLFVRQSRALRTFDSMLTEALHTDMEKSGITVNGGSVPKEVIKESDGTLSLLLENGEVFSGFDCLLEAIGREPVTKTLQLENTSVAVDEKGYVIVDEFQNTGHSGIYALGDVCGKVELTPMAVAAGRRLGDRLFGGLPTAKADYTFVPTVVFSHPVIGTCGFTEAEAIDKFGSDNLKIYNSSFVNLHYGIFYSGGPGDKPISRVKLICVGPEERVVGLHLIGMGSDEVLQGFGVAMKMGATKADFDNCIAIHPTAAEEVVTCAPWGLSGSSSK